MTTFDKAGTFLDYGQAVDYDGVYLLRMDLQSLVMNLLAFIMLSSRAHYMGEIGVLGMLHYRKGQEIYSKTKLQIFSMSFIWKLTYRVSLYPGMCCVAGVKLCKCVAIWS